MERRGEGGLKFQKKKKRLTILSIHQLKAILQLLHMKKVALPKKVLWTF